VQLDVNAVTLGRIPVIEQSRTELVAPVAAWDLGLRSATPAPGRLSEILIGIHASNRCISAVAVDAAVLTLVGLGVGVVPPWLSAVWAAAVVLLGYLGRMYGDRDTIQTRGVLWYPGKSVVPVSLVAFCGLGSGLLHRREATLLVVLAVVALSAVRLVTWLTLAVTRQRGTSLRPAMVVGSGPSADVVWRKLTDFPEGGLRPVAHVPMDALSTDGALAREIRRSGVQHVVVVPAHVDEVNLAAHLQRTRGLDTRLSIVPPLADLFLHPARVSELGGVPFIPLGRAFRGRTSFPGKRQMDVLVASVVLLVASPLLLLAAIAIKLDDGGPVFFRQRRVGKGGETFGMLKLRSMVVGADRLQAELGDHNVSDGLLFRMARDPRVTRVGRLLRRSSIDELPQLWNVIRGTMSLVGPRPLPVDPTKFDGLATERHDVLPGITGYWQISGGNGLSYEEMIKLDLAYIRSWSLWLDVRLLARTIPALVHRHDPC
jgi:exopolysaccharide biosynthesis polyprenyl glycosylphosphotransferase